MQREYGYIGPEEQESQPIVMRKGQNVAGYSVGILYLDNVWYPLVPGNVVNACTYDFPVRMKAVPGLDTPKLHSGDPAIFGTLLEAAKALEQEGVRAISAACGFFGHFHTQLAEAMDLPPSTVHRILQTFCEKKYVIRDDRSHTYRLGPALIPLGKAAARGIRLQDAAHGILAQLAKQTKEDAYLVIPVGNKGLVIEKVDGPSHLKVVEEFGYEMYMHCGAIRKVLLAWQTPAFIDEYFKNIILHDQAFPDKGDPKTFRRLAMTLTRSEPCESRR